MWDGLRPDPAHPHRPTTSPPPPTGPAPAPTTAAVVPPGAVGLPDTAVLPDTPVPPGEPTVRTAPEAEPRSGAPRQDHPWCDGRRYEEWGRDESRQDECWWDDAAGRLVRPYAVSGGRTRPLMALDPLSRLRATGRVPQGHLTPEHHRARDSCRLPVAVAELAVRLRLPMAVTKVLLGDLLDCGALTVQAPAYHDDPTDRALLEAVLDGLRRQL